MKIERFTLGMVNTNCYILINDETKEAVVIDPGDKPDYFVNHFEKEGYQLKGILLTHGHFDHITGVDALVEKYQAPVYAMEEEIELLKEPKLNMSGGSHKVSVDGIQPLVDGQVIAIAGLDIKVIATPGHTSGGCCYYIEAEQVLFAGDTLFESSVGRTDLPTGNHNTLVKSIQEKLLVLPEETVVYPGHMSDTTIGNEKKYNPYL